MYCFFRRFTKKLNPVCRISPIGKLFRKEAEVEDGQLHEQDKLKNQVNINFIIVKIFIIYNLYIVISIIFVSECLTISSDEEDDNRKQKRLGDGKEIVNSQNSATEEAETILEKEPVITNNSVSPMIVHLPNSQYPLSMFLMDYIK